MILFVFEGEKRERKLFKTLEELYFPKKSEHIICSFCNNIYSLYRRVSETGEDIVSIIKSKSSNSEKINWSQLNVGDFSQVFLFFDYDCHDSSASDEKLEEMLDFFDNETENGKLYISYPMIEAIRYTKELPDKDFHLYTVPVSDCADFKNLADEFSFYKNLDFISHCEEIWRGANSARRKIGKDKKKLVVIAESACNESKLYLHGRERNS